MSTIAQKGGLSATDRRPRAGTAPRRVGALTATRPDAGLAILRVIAGVVFLAHGTQKLFVFGIPGVAAGFEGMGVPFPAVAATLVTLGEFLGGIALLAGFLTRPAAAGLAVIMLGATLLAHLPAGFFAPDGVEFTLTLFGVAAAFALIGPGALSLDAMLERRRDEG